MDTWTTYLGQAGVETPCYLHQLPSPLAFYDVEETSLEKDWTKNIEGQQSSTTMEMQHTRLVTNKFLVSLNISINFSASTSHSLSESFSPANIPDQISFNLRYPFTTSFSFSASNSLNCAWVKRLWTRAFDLGAALSSENSEVFEGLTVSSVWFATFGFPRFLRESMTALF